LILGACGGGPESVSPPSPPAEPEVAEVAEAAFQTGVVHLVDPLERPDSGEKAHAEVPRVIALLNSFYSSAFLDPAKWQGGLHPDLAPLFTAEAQPGAAGNLTNLAMSDLSDRIESVEPLRQTLDKVTFLVAEDGSVPIGVASVTFEATGKPAGDGPDVTITHTGHYWLQREGDEYKISAFEVSMNAAEGPDR